MKPKLPNGKVVEEDEFVIALYFEPREDDNPCLWAFNLETGEIEHQRHPDCNETRQRLGGPTWVNLPVVDPMDEWRWFLDYVPEAIHDAVADRGMVSRSISLLEDAGGCRYDWQDHKHQRALREAKKFFRSVGVSVVRDATGTSEGDSQRPIQPARTGRAR